MKLCPPRDRQKRSAVAAKTAGPHDRPTAGDYQKAEQPLLVPVDMHTISLRT
jgi:hypothetical protein